MTTYAELRALAEAAEPHLIPRHPSSGGCSGCRLTEALDPQSILALLDELDAAQAAVRDLAVMAGVHPFAQASYGGGLCVHCDGLREVHETWDRHAPAIAAAREGGSR